MPDLVRVENFDCNHQCSLLQYGHIWVRTYAVCANCGKIRLLTWKDTPARIVNRLLLWSPGIAFLAGVAFLAIWDLFHL